MSEEDKKGVERQDKRGVLDRVLSKIASRKLVVFTIACVGLFYNKTLSGEEFTNIALFYVGSQGLIDAISTWRRAGN